MSDSIDLKSNTNYVYLKDTNDNIAVPRTSLSAVDLTAGNGIRVLGNMIYTADATAEDIIHGTGASGVVTPAKLKEAIDDGFLANPDIATVDAILSGSTGQMIDPNGLKSALTVAQAADVTTLGATTMGGDVSSLNYLDTFTLVGTWDNNVNPNEYVLNKYGFGINGTGDSDPTKYPKYAEGLKYLFIMDIKLVGGSFASIFAMNNGARQNLLIDGGSLSDYNWHRYAFEFDSNAAYFIINITKNSSVQLKNVRQYEVTALTDDAIKALAGFEDPDDFEYSHIVDQNMINPWLQIIDMGSSPEVLVYPGLSYKINAQNNNVKLSVPSIPANKSGLDSYVELYVGGEGSVAVQRPLVLGSTITPYSTNQCTVKFRDGRAVLTIDEVSQDYVVTVTSGVEGDALSGSLYYGLVYATANQIAFNSGLDGEVISLPDNTVIASVRDVAIKGNGAANTKIGNCAFIIGSTPSNSTWATLEDLTITGATYATGYQWLFTGTVHDCIITGNTLSTSLTDGSMIYVRGASPSVGFLNCLVTGNTVTSTRSCLVTCNASNTIIQGSRITDNVSQYSLALYSGPCFIIDSVIDGTVRLANQQTNTVSGSVFENILCQYSRTGFNITNTNIITGQITGTGTTTLTATSVLDLSNNTHAAVASGGTVSAAAGAKIIALGGNTVTISANTSGSYLLNNGTITSDVYIVTVGGASTGSGSLIYGMTASSAGNILFDSSVDGSTITLPGSSVGTYRAILGNGTNNTIISGSTMTGAGANMSALDMNFSVSVSSLTMTDCYVHGQTIAVQVGSVSHQKGNIYGYNSYFTNVHFDSLNTGTLTDNGWGNIVCYGGGIHKLTNCIYENSKNTAAHIFCWSTDITGCTFYNNQTTYSNENGCIVNSYNQYNRIVDCLFVEANKVTSDSYMRYALSAQSSAGTLISGCTFASDYDNIYVSGPSILDGINNIKGVIIAPTSGSKINLVTGSVLDLTSNTHSCAIYGASPSSVSITGTTINVVASTASDAAIGGTATVLYNDNGVTKERKLTGGGAGYIMRNNGAWGVPVTVASGTASGSLYDLIMTTKPRDITFAPVMDGQTVSTAWLNMYQTASHWCYLMGAGVNKTTLNVTNLIMTGGYHARMSDMTVVGMARLVYLREANNLYITGCYPYQSDQNMFYIANSDHADNIRFSGCTASTAQGILQLNSNSSVTNVEITGCSGAYMDIYMNADTGNTPIITGGTFTNNRCTDTSMGIVRTGGGGAAYSLVNCIFNNPTNTSYAINTYGALTISGGTFSSSGDGIYVQADKTVTFSGTNILNSTVSGAGTVAFADGATVTSTIPSGSTIGTGVISCVISAQSTNQKMTLENITITGVTNGVTIPIPPSGGETVVTNCLITGNTGSSSGWQYALSTYNSDSTIRLTGTTITGNADEVHNMIYCYSGYMYITDCIIGTDIKIYSGGTVIIDGTNNSIGRYLNLNTPSSGGRCIFMPNSITRINAIASTNNTTIYVGTYDAGTNTVTTTGTATVVLNGTTVSISGSGTIIDNTGLHS